ncbi:MAG: replication-associated recombination protein A [Dehalococcoidia bacterium]
MEKQTKDLFQRSSEDQLERDAPLAARMRPHTFDEFVGQEHIVGKGRVLRASIEADQLPSMILWGPPGSGKTTLARIIANITKANFQQISAVAAGVADLRRIVDEAREHRGMYQLRTVLFIDELHRFNKAQQDVILPYVENGTVTLIGATTENPSFEVIAPLLSRCRVYSLNPLDDDQIGTIVERALSDGERGLGNRKVKLETEAREHLITLSNGDARVALNALELAASATPPDAQGERRIDLKAIEDAMQRRSLIYDKAGDLHYDTISAFIKSLRGSDPDAALYWLARMLEAGEDPLFVVRRMVVLAAEDVGLADPQALVVAVAAQQAVHFVGMPEGFLPLAEAVIYLATAPKSNAAYVGYLKAKEDVEKTRNDPVPLHLRNPVTRLMREVGYGKGYKYAHDYPGHVVEQVNLPDKLAGRRYYQPSDQGYEKQIGERLRKWVEEREK